MKMAVKLPEGRGSGQSPARPKINWKLLGWLALALVILFALLLIVSSANADFSGSNTIFYGPEPVYNTTLADANQSYVHQGDNITQGNYYDLSGIYGFSGIIEAWKDDIDDAGITQPDYTFVVSGSPGLTYIDPKLFPAYSRWYQDDGGSGANCNNANSNAANYFSGGNLVTSSANTGNNGVCTNGFLNDNAFVFTVLPPASNMTPINHTVVKTINITEQVGNQTIVVPFTYTEVETPVITPVATLVNEQVVNTVTTRPTLLLPTTATIPVTTIATTVPVTGPTEQNVVDINGDPVQGIAGGVPTVTAKSPMPVRLSLIALGIVLGVVLWRRK